MKELLLVIIGAVLADNLVLGGYFGFDSCVLGENKKCFALSVAGVLLVSTLASNLICGLINFEYVEIMVFALVILLSCRLPALVLGDKAPSYALLVLNSLLMGAAINAVSMSFAEALCFALGTALGFWGLLEIFDSLRIKLSNPAVPKAMQGMPVMVLAAGIISMAIYAF